MPSPASGAQGGTLGSTGIGLAAHSSCDEPFMLRYGVLLLTPYPGLTRLGWPRLCGSGQSLVNLSCSVDSLCAQSVGTPSLLPQQALAWLAKLPAPAQIQAAPAEPGESRHRNKDTLSPFSTQRWSLGWTWTGKGCGNFPVTFPRVASGSSHRSVCHCREMRVYTL